MPVPLAAAAGPPTLGAESPVSNPIVIPNGNYPEAPAMASNGTGFLAAWWEEENYLIKATRMTGAGEVLDIGGIEIGSSDHAGIDIAWDGTNYVVAWTNFSQVLATRVSSAGVVLDERPIVIGGHFQGVFGADVVGSGAGSLFVLSYQSNVYAVRMNSEGVVLDEQPIPVSTAPDFQGGPAVAWSGDEFLAVWADGRSGAGNDIYGTRIAADGTVLDPDGIGVSITPGRQDAPDISWTGTSFFVVWTSTVMRKTSINAARLDALGGVIDPDPILVTAEEEPLHPRISSNGVSTVIVWSSYPHTRAVSFDTRGGPLRSSPLTLTSGSNINGWHAIASLPGGSHLVAIAANADNSWRIRSVRLDAQGTAALDQDPTDVSVAIDDQYDPTFVWNGNEFLAVWGNEGLWTSRVTTDGTILSDRPIRVVPPGAYQFDVEWVDDHYVMVWQVHTGGAYRVVTIRLNADGTLLDQTHTKVGRVNGGASIDVASSGTESLAVWEAGTGVVGYLIGRDGSVLTPEPIVISDARDHQTDPSVAWNGTNYLVVWEDYRNRRLTHRSDLYAARVSKRSRVLDRDGIVVSREEGWQTVPAVASNGSSSLVTWMTETRENCTIQGAVVSAEGRVTRRDIGISTRRKCEGFPAVAWTGENHVVAWANLIPYAGRAKQVFAARVKPVGRVLDPGGIEIASRDEMWPVPSVASSGAATAIVYSDYVPGDEFKGALRAYTRLLED